MQIGIHLVCMFEYNKRCQQTTINYDIQFVSFERQLISLGITIKILDNCYFM